MLLSYFFLLDSLFPDELARNTEAFSDDEDAPEYEAEMFADVPDEADMFADIPGRPLDPPSKAKIIMPKERFDLSQIGPKDDRDQVAPVEVDDELRDLSAQCLDVIMNLLKKPQGSRRGTSIEERAYTISELFGDFTKFDNYIEIDSVIKEQKITQFVKSPHTVLLTPPLFFLSKYFLTLI